MGWKHLRSWSCFIFFSADFRASSPNFWMPCFRLYVTINCTPCCIFLMSTHSLNWHMIIAITLASCWEYDIRLSIRFAFKGWNTIFTNCLLVVVVLHHCCHCGHYYSHWLTGLGLDHFLVDLVHLKDGLPLYHLGWPHLFLWLDHHQWHPVSLLLHHCFRIRFLHSCKQPFMVVSVGIVIGIIMMHSCNSSWVKQNMAGFCVELKAFHALAFCQFFNGLNDSLCHGNNGDLAPGNHSAHSKM